MKPRAAIPIARTILNFRIDILYVTVPFSLARLIPHRVDELRCDLGTDVSEAVLIHGIGVTYASLQPGCQRVE